MQSDKYASMREDLSEDRLHDEVRKLLAAMLDRGESPVEVIEAAMATSTALCVDLEGLAGAAVRLLHCGSILGNASPEVQAQVAAEQRKNGATAH